MKKIKITVLILLIYSLVSAENGHKLWLRHSTSRTVEVRYTDKSTTVAIAADELSKCWLGAENAVVELKITGDKTIKKDGFRLSQSAVIATSPTGILYGVYEMLRIQQTRNSIVEKIYNPSYQIRVLNHWDNLDGYIERGYSGNSIFWDKDSNLLAPTKADTAIWKEYARANASIGINGAVLNNVNASPEVLSPQILLRVRAIANILRPYGIKTYLSVNFSSPALLGHLKTSDPLDTSVKLWWKQKVKEIHNLIPDFGGFLIKANSEGQPGPQDFGRTHADGANMLADALKPYGGIVMWRAFVYSANDHDRAKQAYNEFFPLDGKFRDNVILQVKNGPLDFQPREPFSPLFGAMQQTTIMPEVQITQEYLGHSNHLVFLAPMWEEMMKSDTYCKGQGSTIAKCTDGQLYPQKYSAIAGVANVGLDANWCGHDFAQANWYAFGRLAWDNTMSSEKIADEWIRLTFGNVNQIESKDWTEQFLFPIKKMMLDSREVAVNYMMPLGFNHIFSAGDHYGPGPWNDPRGNRISWMPPYYHQASEDGVGFNRTRSGSKAVDQYHEPLTSQLNDPAQCPENLLLWFHHVPWNYKLKNGHSLWDEICIRYTAGMLGVGEFQKVWDKVEKYVDPECFLRVQSRLRCQRRDAQVWHDACLLYFGQFSKMPIPYELERPQNDLQILINNDFNRFK
ncbi:MAG: alpha-glucuronidase [Bacteroidales bacterium]